LQQKNYSLAGLDTIILDEADQMLDIGFLPQIKMILADAPSNRQTLMFSATMPAPIAEISAKHMKMPLRIAVAPSGTPAKNIAQEIYILPQELKLCLLNKILKEQVGSILVFSRTKHGARKICAAVNQMGQTAIDIHSNKSLGQRKQALTGFKNGKYRVLVATDIAARGIDVKNITMVINYDLPDNSEDYVHRIGRTGRAGNSGKAVSFATNRQFSDIKQIERLIKRSIPISKLPVLPKFIAQKPTFQEHTPSYRSRKPEWKRKTGFTQNRSRNFNSKYQRQKAN
jgi:ATP-dependent RNA helicase RhlE